MKWEEFEITPSRNNFTYNGIKLFEEDSMQHF
jgi:phosphomannomutase